MSPWSAKQKLKRSIGGCQIGRFQKQATKTRKHEKDENYEKDEIIG